MRLDKDTKDLIKKATQEIIEDKKQRDALLEKDIDYNFLKKLLQEVNANPGLKIEIFLKSGNRILIKYEEEKAPSTFDLINGDYMEVK